jgi:histidinol-phosphate phosphatase family protein
MRLAAAGLALRGHDVRWLGRHAPATLVEAGVIRHFTRPVRRRLEPADLVLGGARQPLRTAANGWFAAVHGMLLGLDPAAVRGWTMFDRWAWGSLDSGGLFEAGTREAQTDVAGVPAASLGAWSLESPPETPASSHPDVEALERACERGIARRRGLSPRPAVFLDRDGTLVVEKGYLSHADDLQLFAGVPRALARLHAAGFILVVVSNQSGVGRGFFPVARVYEAMARLRGELRSRGVELDAVYFCPHRPEAGCDCRKPGSALLKQAASNLNLALRRSAMVGDKLLDVETGHRVGAAGILLRTGYGRDEEQRAPELGWKPPEHVAEDLEAAAIWLEERITAE